MAGMAGMLCMPFTGIAGLGRLCMKMFSSDYKRWQEGQAYKMLIIGDRVMVSVINVTTQNSNSKFSPKLLFNIKIIVKNTHTFSSFFHNK